MATACGSRCRAYFRRNLNVELHGKAWPKEVRASGTGSISLNQTTQKATTGQQTARDLGGGGGSSYYWAATGFPAVGCVASASIYAWKCWLGQSLLTPDALSGSQPDVAAPLLPIYVIGVPTKCSLRDWVCFQPVCNIIVRRNAGKAYTYLFYVTYYARKRETRNVVLFGYIARLQTSTGRGWLM